MAQPDARPSEVEATDRKRAKQLYELGARLFEAGEYLEAAKTFGESFGLEPRPGSLFNQGRCFEEAGAKEDAISAYKRYLVLEPNGDASEEALTRQLALERKLEIEAGKGDVDTSKGPITDGGTDVSTGGSLKWAGVATGGVGIAVFATGVFFGLKAKSLSDELEGRDPGTWTDAEIQTFNDGERANTVGITLMGVGAAAVIGGGVLYYLGSREKSDVQITPSVTPDSAGASVTLTF